MVNNPAVRRRRERGLVRARLAAAVLIAGLSLVGDAAGARGQYQPPWATGDSRPEDLEISLVTFGPGDPVPSYFGHNALIVRDRRLDVSLLYNYGMFTFDREMLPKFLMGRLEFWVGQAPVGATFAGYRRMNRSIRVQRLDLEPAARELVAEQLAHDVLPENRTYLYHHYFDNCSTRVRDIVDQAVGGQLRAAAQEPARMSFREHTRRYVQHDPIIDFVLLFWMNDQMEQPIKRWHEMFLPQELQRAVAELGYRRQDGSEGPLVTSHRTVYRARRAPVPARAPLSWPLWLGCGVLAGLVALGTVLWVRSGRWPRLARVTYGLEQTAVGLAFGVPGLLGMLMWLFTEHSVTYRNENLWLANPLTFALLPLGIAMAWGSGRARRWLRWVWYALVGTSVLGVALKLLPAFDQDTLLTSVLILPVNLGFAAAAWLLDRAPAPLARAAIVSRRSA